jgi:hypothetical protein
MKIIQQHFSALSARGFKSKMKPNSQGGIIDTGRSSTGHRKITKTDETETIRNFDCEIDRLNRHSGIFV